MGAPIRKPTREERTGRHKRIRHDEELSEEELRALAKKYGLTYPWPGMVNGKTYKSKKKHGTVPDTWKTKNAIARRKLTRAKKEGRKLRRLAKPTYMRRDLRKHPLKRKRRLKKTVEVVYKNLRIKLKLSFKKIQKVTGIGPVRYQNWEDGFSVLTPEEEKKVQDMFLPYIFRNF